MKKLKTLAAGLLLGVGLTAGSYAAQKFPLRPIELTVVYPAGGGMDVTARTLAHEAERVLGYKFRVQNRTGGGGVVGHTWLAKEAPADGYSVGVLANPFLAIDMLDKDAKMKPTDFTPIAGINFTPVVWVVKADGPYGKYDFKQLIGYARSNPGKLTIAVIPNSTFDFVSSLVEEQEKAKITHVPFQGGKPGITALLGGNVDVASAFYEEIEPYLKAGQVKALAVSDTVRYPIMPDVPAMGELGIKISKGVWGASRFITVPPATDPAIKEKLAADFMKVMKDPQAVKKFESVGTLLSPVGTKEAQENFDLTYKTIKQFIADRK